MKNNIIKGKLWCLMHDAHMLFDRTSKCIDGRKAEKNRVNLEWWNYKDNVGDVLSPVICEWMLEQRNLSFNSNANKTYHLMALGSICGEGQVDAVVWGSGVHNDALRKNIYRWRKIRKLDIRAVRGPKTADVLRKAGYACPNVYGDPAILMPFIYMPPYSCGEKKYKKSVIIHFSGKDNLVENDDFHYIDVETKDYKKFIDEIVSSELVISSSLHGIILAESYGVPAIFLKSGIEKEILKFEDWYSSTGRSDFAVAENILEASKMAPTELPKLDKLQSRLMESFPYDLWK